MKALLPLFLAVNSVIALSAPKDSTQQVRLRAAHVDTVAAKKAPLPVFTITDTDGYTVLFVIRGDSIISAPHMSRRTVQMAFCGFLSRLHENDSAATLAVRGCQTKVKAVIQYLGAP